MAEPSLGHYASLSFFVIGRRQGIEVKGKKKGIFLWKRLPRPVCSEPVEWIEGQPRSYVSTIYRSPLTADT
jgi:hypothetical protein